MLKRRSPPYPDHLMAAKQARLAPTLDVCRNLLTIFHVCRPAVARRLSDKTTTLTHRRPPKVISENENAQQHDPQRKYKKTRADIEAAEQ